MDYPIDAAVQERAYEGMSIATAPFRWVKSLIMTVVLLVLVFGLGVGYPFYLFFTGQPVTAVSLVISALTFLGFSSLIFAPYYTFLGGILGAVLFSNAIDAHGQFMADTFQHGWNFALLLTAFFTLGLVQRYIRFRVKRHRLCVKLNRMKRQQLARKMGAMGPLQFANRRRMYGDNYLNWPV